MKSANGWLNPDLIEKWRSTDEASRQSGLFMVRWESGLEPGKGPSPLRIGRILSALALRISKIADSVRGWTQTEDSLIIVVSFAEEEADDREISAGRMAFLIRDTAHRILVEFQYPAAVEGNGAIRCGFGWATGVENKAESAEECSGKWERALMKAYDTAWQRMQYASSPLIRLPIAERNTDSQGFDFQVRYLPIVSLLDGSLYGYEAVPVDARKGERIDLQYFYSSTDQAGKLFELDRKFREAAIRGLPSRNGDVKLFLPVPAKIIFDPRLYPGSTLRRIEAANLRPEHVVLVIVGGEDELNSTMRSALSHYRNQGFRIALSEVTPALKSLRRMTALHPDYSLMNVEWMSNEGIGTVEENLLQALIGIARKEQIVMIAKGLHGERMLPALVASGMNYAQREWLGDVRGGDSLAHLPDLRASIRSEVNKRFRGASGTMSELVNPVKQFARETAVSEISRHFELHREAPAIVISDNGRPIGLLMKEKLLHLLSGQFGLPLYWNRPVGKIMDTHPMIVEESVTVDQASQMAMAREPDKLYDEVIITRGGVVAGIASIRSMLEWISQSRMNDAQWANPLSGLPGNEPIRREMIRRLADGRPFAVLYADLDHFKWYNDRYGFQKGDDVIRYTGDILVHAVREEGNGDCFIGHIGGDDFIVISSGVDVLEMAHRVIGRFQQGIGAYGGTRSETVHDRSGYAVEAPVLSLSLSLLLCRSASGWTPETLSEQAAHLKKKAKQQIGNSIVWETIERCEPIEVPASPVDLTSH
ncbi:GGDEF domain-containing protein [Cohnella terricola]|nr:GGDEF domain-containing protein [Cohnella terricola]